MSHLWIDQSLSILWKDKMGIVQVMLGVRVICMVPGNTQNSPSYPDRNISS